MQLLHLKCGYCIKLNALLKLTSPPFLFTVTTEIFKILLLYSICIIFLSASTALDYQTGPLSMKTAWIVQEGTRASV